VGGGTAPLRASESLPGAVGQACVAAHSTQRLQERLLESRTGHVLRAWAPGSFGAHPHLARDIKDLAGGAERFPVPLVLGSGGVTEEGALRALGEFAYITRPLPSAEMKLVEASKSAQRKLAKGFEPGVPLGGRLKIVYMDGARGFGVCAAEPIAEGTIICVYAGVLIERRVANQAMHDNVYLMDVGRQWTIDAKRYRNVGAFVNFSCAPNLKVATLERWQLSASASRCPWPVFVATQRIEAGDELTYMRDKNALGMQGNEKCRCGKATCQGFY